MLEKNETPLSTCQFILAIYHTFSINPSLTYISMAWSTKFITILQENTQDWLAAKGNATARTAVVQKVVTDITSHKEAELPEEHLPSDLDKISHSSFISMTLY